MYIQCGQGMVVFSTAEFEGSPITKDSLASITYDFLIEFYVFIVANC